MKLLGVNLEFKHMMERINAGIKQKAQYFSTIDSMTV